MGSSQCWCSTSYMIYCSGGWGGWPYFEGPAAQLWGGCGSSPLPTRLSPVPTCSRKLKWYALCPVVDAINHSSLVEVRGWRLCAACAWWCATVGHRNSNSRGQHALEANCIGCMCHQRPNPCSPMSSTNTSGTSLCCPRRPPTSRGSRWARAGAGGLGSGVSCGMARPTRRNLVL